MVFRFFKRKQTDTNITSPETIHGASEENHLPADLVEADEAVEVVTVVPEAVVNKNTFAADGVKMRQRDPFAKSTVVVAEEVVTITHVEEANSAKMSWAQRLKQGLAKTRDSFGKKFFGVFGGGKIDEGLYEELETALLGADIGFSATNRLLEQIRKKVSLKGLKDGHELKLVLKDCLVELLLPIEKPLQTSGHKPFVIMLVGVNGAGKTTSIGKLAKCNACCRRYVSGGGTRAIAGMG